MAVYRPTYTSSKTGKKKQSRIWWINFTIAGKRLQESTNTPRKTVAVEYAKKRRLDIERALAGLPSQAAADRIASVSERIKSYLGSYALNHRAQSVRFATQRLAHVKRLLGACMLCDLTADRIEGYIRARLDEGVGNRTVNMEVGELSRSIGLKWSVAWPSIRKLGENHDVGRALEQAEEEAIMDAATRNQSRLIYPFLFTLAWTGLRSDEGRTLRWTQIDMGGDEITVGGSKSAAGKGRKIPMTANLKAVLLQHAAWITSKLGPIRPEWYVFPQSNRLALKDPLKPITSVKTAWESVRKTAGVDCRLHDLRHSFCTKLAEAGVPESTMLAMMGHMSRAMLERYSHIRVQARRHAIDAIEARHISNELAKVSAKVDETGSAKHVLTH